MELTPKPVWIEGMFLTPHHFQQWDLHYESEINAKFHSLSRYHWGVLELEIDADSLMNGTFAVRNFKAIMADGLLVSVGPLQDPLPCSRPMGPAFAAALDHLDIYLGVPVERADTGNCTTDGEGNPVPLRYNARALERVDYNTGNNKRTIMVARQNVQLFFGSEDRSSYHTIKIAEVERISGSNFRRRGSYVPPSLILGSSSELALSLQGVMNILYAKRNELTALQQPANQFNKADLDRFFLLSILNAALPVFAHMDRSQFVHPEAVYMVLASLLGQLRTFCSGGDLTQVPVYQHENLAATFSALREEIRVVIEGINRPRFWSMMLPHVKDNTWIGKVLDESVLKKSELYLAIEGGVDEGRLRDLAAKQLKLGSAEDIDRIVRRALPGVRISEAPRVPNELPVRTGRVYYRIETQGEFWHGICRTRSMAITTSDTLNVSFELLAPEL